VASLVIYIFILGNPGNFVDGANREKPTNLMGSVYTGGIIVPILITLSIMVVTFVVERVLSLRKAQGRGSLATFLKNVQRSLASGDIEWRAPLGSVEDEYGAGAKDMGASTIGPTLVTLDELEQYEVPCKEGHTGKAWNLSMKCWVNGIQVSEGNVSDMDWTFAEIIERASYGVNLYAGDIIGSGTVGTGCFLELNGTGKLNDPNYQEQWLQDGDVVEMEIDGLGKLSNTIVKDESDFSILELKKVTG